MISQETIEQVKNIGIVDVVSETTSLKRNGANYSGLCPFHNEKTSSFHVKADDNFYHCFGCGESGNVITFVMKTQGLSFPDTVEYLANRFNIPIVYTQNKKEPQGAVNSNAIYKLNSLAYEFYSSRLRDANNQVKEYVTGRGIEESDITNFGIGYAPNEWQSLYDFIKSRGVVEELMLASGLIKKSSSGKLYDTFRNRLIFPVWTDNKRIAGFGGRILPGEDKEQAKYLNSPETLVYKKSTILYGFPQSYKAIKDSGNVYVVEGYMDVVGLHKAGVINAVATCGTALTSGHVKKLSSSAKQIFLLFDGDDAGKAASAKSFKQMVNLDSDISVIFLPDGKDPDDIASENGDQSSEYISNLPKTSLMECYLKHSLKSYNVDKVSELGAVNKSKIAKEIMQIISLAENSLIKSELTKEACFLLNTRVEDLMSVIGKVPERKEVDKWEDIEEEENEVVENRKIDELDYFNKTVLQAVITEKETLPDKIINDSGFCEYLDSVTIRFISSLQDIMESDSSIDTQAKRMEMLKLLSSYDPSWTVFWKKAHKLKEDPLVKTENLLIQCEKEIKRRRMVKTISQIEEKSKETQDMEEKAQLLQQKLELSRELNKYTAMA